MRIIKRKSASLNYKIRLVNSTEVLGAVAESVKQMAQNMATKPTVSGLERLSVLSWDGSRKTYATWKIKEFNHWMGKYMTKTEMNSFSASVTPCQRGLGGQTK